MSSPILGLHHVTATVDDAQADVDFSVSALGLRLVKKTVNFDNHFVYHFYYGDEVGHPGTIWTTFPYKGRGVAVGSKGAGQITVTSFSVPAGSLDAWKTRLRERGYVVTDAPPRFGEESVLITDPSGLVIELVANDADVRLPWAKNGLGTVHHVAMAVGSEDDQLKIRGELEGVAHVTPVRDRQYFKSIYFREPGGVLFEIATTRPGFPVDEPVSALGRGLKLPPWEEPNRTEIEAQLPNVHY